jgi:uncharacterized protein YifE (UPF0438 family)
MTELLRTQLLSKRDYLKQFTILGLTPRERELLDAAGYWLEALATGKAVPISEKGKRFVDVALGKAEPVTEYERAWAKLQALILVNPFFVRLASGEFSCIRELGGERQAVIYDCLVELLSDHAQASSDQKIRDLMFRAELKVRDIQFGRQTIDGGPVTNWGGLHTYGL